MSDKTDEEDAVPEHIPRALSRAYDEIDSRLKTLENKQVEHSVRLINGTHVMAEIKQSIERNRDDVRELERRLVPKPVDMWKYFIFAVSLLMSLAAAGWALSEKLSSRPTTEQVKEMIHVYSVPATGH